MRALPRGELLRRSTATDLAALGFPRLEAACREAAAAYRPHQQVGVEPRDGFPIVYSEARALRLALPAGTCVVCDGLTCPAVDHAPLPGDDVAWLTPNLYPIVYPFQEPAGARGVHLVQWSSLRHDRGLPGAEASTATVLVEQLARAEELLLHTAPPDWPASGPDHRGHVGLIKNRGRRVGGSVEHDHQQLLLAAAAPAEPARAAGLAGHLLAHTPAPLVVERLQGATVLVPPFMRRPLHAFVVPHGEPAGWLHHLPPAVRADLALALSRLCAAVTALMTATHGEPAWNLVCHAGPGCGPLFELRPFTQPLGGYEHLGLYLCEELPATSAGRLREAFAALG